MKGHWNRPVHYIVQLSYTTMLFNSKMATILEKRSTYVAALILEDEGLGRVLQNYKFWSLILFFIFAKMLNSRRFIPVFVKRVRVLQTRRAFGRISVRTTAHVQRTVQNILLRWGRVASCIKTLIYCFCRRLVVLSSIVLFLSSSELPPGCVIRQSLQFNPDALAVMVCICT